MKAVETSKRRFRRFFMKKMAYRNFFKRPGAFSMAMMPTIPDTTESTIKILEI